MEYEFDELLNNIEKKNFKIINKENDQAVVQLPNSNNCFVLLRSGSWLQVAAILIENDEMTKSSFVNLLGETVLRIHSRYLGCRIGYDDDNNLTIQQDIYPENQKPEHLERVFWQMNYVGNSILPLIEKTLNSGKIPDDEEIERSFS